MNAALQDAIKEAFAIAPAGKVVLHTLEIRQTGVQPPIFLVQSRQGISATDENGDDHVFEPAGFQFSLPPISEDGFQSLNLAIDNVGRRINTFIKAAVSQRVPVEVVYRPYLSDDLTQPQMVPPLVLYLKDIAANPAQVTGRATFMDIVNLPFPSELYGRSRFPSL